MRLMRHGRRGRELDEVLASGPGPLRARLQAEGVDLDRMSEDEVMDHIDRVIHEYRQAQRHEERT